MTLKRRLIDRIAAGGPLPFEEFMEAALYDAEGGFFAAGPLRSVEGGDFLTSPEVSARFGQELARFVGGERDRLGAPPGFAVIDAGAGSGSLLAPLLESVGQGVQAFAVEASPAARAQLAAVVGDQRVLSALGEVPGPLPGVVIANELVDNLPMAIAVRTGDGWEERWVGESDGELMLVARPTRSTVAAWCDRFAAGTPPGGLVEVQLAAGHWVETALSVLTAGTLVIIDYGGSAEELVPRRTQGTLRTYRAHHLGPDPLSEPGATDITADVNFSALAAVASDCGAVVEVLRQDDFLNALGLGDDISELRHLELQLARRGEEMARLRTRSERMDAETLLHPRGLGDFRVLLARVGNLGGQG
jgi:SAM-dependent MidA family methyltransferase